VFPSVKMKAEVSCKPIAGQIDRARTRDRQVDEVATSPSGTWLRPSCVEDNAQGESLEFSWENKPDAHVLDAEALAKIGQKGFHDARHFAAYFNSLQWHSITVTDTRVYRPSCRALHRGRDFLTGRNAATGI
jgi:hypothetical protein